LKMHQNQNSPQEQDQVYQSAQQLVPFAHYSPKEATQNQNPQSISNTIKALKKKLLAK